jgi:hypothetical protein
MSGSQGPNRVVDRRSTTGFPVERRWDVYNDEIGDFVATMNPTLPVSSRAEAERICDSLNASDESRRAAIAKARGQ